MLENIKPWVLYEKCYSFQKFKIINPFDEMEFIRTM